MKMLKESYLGDFDLLIYGLGYESRATYISQKYHDESKMAYALGYDSNTECLFYQKNETYFLEANVVVISGEDESVINAFKIELLKEIENYNSILIDITVMSRHRLASILDMLLKYSTKDTKVTIVYAPSVFVSPPNDITPIKKVSEITSEFTGSLGDLSKPTSLIMGLGYEKNKALGLSSYLDSGSDFLFIPKSSEGKFEEIVLDNNKELITQTENKNILYYYIDQPYATYLNLRSLILSVMDYSRPLVVPLGPKVLAAISVVIGRELYPNLPVWRVSSEHTEVPVERKANGQEISFTIQI